MNYYFLYYLQNYYNKNKKMKIDIKKMPDDFVYLTDIDNEIQENVRYFTEENFLGKQVNGYKANRIICTIKAAHKLKLVHDEIKKQGYNLLVYDGYRPQDAPDEFLKWSCDEEDQIAKKYYYPELDKKNMFDLGYIAKKSSHSRGSTFDLTLIKQGVKFSQLEYKSQTLENGEKIPFLDDGSVNMGTSFDLFHEASHPGSKLVNKEACFYRDIIHESMSKFGFVISKVEWWHFTLKDEPYPNIYFNFPII